MAYVVNCRFCDFSTTSIIKNIRHHFRHRHISSRYHCGVSNCQSSFQTEASLRSHLIRFHNATAVSSTQSSHPNSRNQNAEYVCTVPICKKIFVNYNEFLKHLKYHMKLGILTNCPVQDCVKSYKNVQSFTSHLSKCHPAKPVTSCPSQAESIGIQEESVTINSDMFLEGDELEGDELDADLSEPELLETFCQFFMKLEFDLFLPATSVQYIASELGALQSQNSSVIEKRLRNKLKNFNVSNVDDIVSYILDDNPISSVQKKLKTDYLRKEAYKKVFSFVEPIRLQTRNKHFYYVPLKDTVKALFSDKGINFVPSPPRFSNVNDVLKDYTDGFVFKNNQFFVINPLGLHLLLYQDAFEVVVPIGPAKKIHKLLAVYLLIGNIPVHLRSRVSSIQLVALCIEKNFDHNAVYGPIVKDLKDLETVGVHVSETIGTVKGSLVCVVGDNLGSHGLGGFVEQFSTSIFFCRFCHVNRKIFNSIGGELVSFELRTKQSYNDCLNKKAAQTKKVYKGLKFNSVFNELKYFHVCNPGLSPCLAHDLFEGLAAYDMKLYVDYFVKKGWFSYDMLNQALSSFNFSIIDKRDRPIPVSEKYSRIKGGAWQVCTFIRLFPLLVKDFILDEEDPVWLLVLSLIEIVEIVISPVIHKSYLPYLQLCINDYLSSRKDLFSEPLRPKHHYLWHYPYLITAFGPLIRVFTLRFESKHVFFKRCIRSSRNFINPTFSLSLRHELYQAYIRSASDKHCKVSTQGESDFYMHTFCDEIQRAIISKKLSTNVSDCASVVVTGTSYRKGNIVVLGQKTYQCDIQMGRIVLILYDDHNGTFFLVEKVVTTFIPSLRVYEIGPKTSYECVSVDDLASHQSLHAYPNDSHLYVKLKFGLVFDRLD